MLRFKLAGTSRQAGGVEQWVLRAVPPKGGGLPPGYKEVYYKVPNNNAGAAPRVGLGCTCPPHFF